jgi:transcriptional regulator with XRE-family HTH domain
MSKRELPNERMRRLRRDAGLSLQNLADEVGMSKAHMWELERRYDTIMAASYLNLAKIAAALDTSVARLMAH